LEEARVARFAACISPRRPIPISCLALGGDIAAGERRLVKLVKAISVLAVLLAPLSALAAGGHDSVGCSGCHPRKAGGFAMNTKYLDPRTGQPYTGTTAVCLACHQDVDKGGQGYAPISRHLSHPFGLATVNPKVASVPPAMLKNGRFECMSCHEPHPSNPNYKYLRVDVGPKAEKLDQFCATCHASKAD
jgi:predicted CXXCH cytochrome family protein